MQFQESLLNFRGSARSSLHIVSSSDAYRGHQCFTNHVTCRTYPYTAYTAYTAFGVPCLEPVRQFDLALVLRRVLQGCPQLHLHRLCSFIVPAALSCSEAQTHFEKLCMVTSRIVS